MKTTHSGPRKRKVRKPLLIPKPGPIYVRSTKSCGNTANTLREGAQYTRRANRAARVAGFSEARTYALHLMMLYERLKRLGHLR